MNWNASSTFFFGFSSLHFYKRGFNNKINCEINIRHLPHFSLIIPLIFLIFRLNCLWFRCYIFNYQPNLKKKYVKKKEKKLVLIYFSDYYCLIEHKAYCATIHRFITLKSVINLSGWIASWDILSGFGRYENKMVTK